MARSYGGAVHYKVVLSGQFGVGKSSIFRHFSSHEFGLPDDDVIDDDDDCCDVVTSPSGTSWKRQRNGHCRSTTNSNNNDISNGKNMNINKINDVIVRRQSSASTFPSAPDNYCRLFQVQQSRRNVQLELWDTAGMERFSTMSGHYYANASAVLVVYSTDSASSFSAAVEYIIDAIDSSGSNRMTSSGLAVFLCANEADPTTESERTLNNRERHGVKPEDVARLEREFKDVLCGSYRVSCRSGHGVRGMFEDIVAVLETRAMEKAERTERIALRYMGHERSNGQKVRSCSCG